MYEANLLKAKPMVRALAGKDVVVWRPLPLSSVAIFFPFFSSLVETTFFFSSLCHLIVIILHLVCSPLFSSPCFHAFIRAASFAFPEACSVFVSLLLDLFSFSRPYSLLFMIFCNFGMFYLFLSFSFIFSFVSFINLFLYPKTYNFWSSLVCWQMWLEKR